ncbi:hypothetical protein NDU88_007176 [Pleurodeles waltl]|uniref:Uncharacterized protein n=1 Tax=Pleurodeles waltl TaxID=8319 RepID=A0AAV7UNM4_PLEWA|nr:hypothetical protein NDU88_007176 [Pleurodeles waltl]
MLNPGAPRQLLMVGRTEADLQGLLCRHRPPHWKLTPSFSVAWSQQPQALEMGACLCPVVTPQYATLQWHHQEHACSCPRGPQTQFTLDSLRKNELNGSQQ